MGIGNVSGGGKDESEGVFGGRDGVAARDVGDHDAPLGSGIDVDIVHADARAAHEPKFLAGFQEGRPNFGLGPHQERVGVPDLFFELG